MRALEIGEGLDKPQPHRLSYTTIPLLKKQVGFGGNADQADPVSIILPSSRGNNKSLGSDIGAAASDEVHTNFHLKRNSFVRLTSETEARPICLIIFHNISSSLVLSRTLGHLLEMLLGCLTPALDADILHLVRNSITL